MNHFESIGHYRTLWTFLMRYTWKTFKQNIGRYLTHLLTINDNIQQYWLVRIPNMEHLLTFLSISDKLKQYLHQRTIFDNIVKYQAIYGNIWQYWMILENIWKYLSISSGISLKLTVLQVILQLFQECVVLKLFG